MANLCMGTIIEDEESTVNAPSRYDFFPPHCLENVYE